MKNKSQGKEGMKFKQIPIEERVEGIEKFLVFSFIAVATFIATTTNQTYFLGINIIIFDLSVFFISISLAFYYFMIIAVIVSGRLGESADSYFQKYKSKLVLPFFLSLVLVSGLVMYLLGKNLKDIISSILLVFIGVVIKYSFDYISKKK